MLLFLATLGGFQTKVGLHTARRAFAYCWDSVHGAVFEGVRWFSGNMVGCRGLPDISTVSVVDVAASCPGHLLAISRRDDMVVSAKPGRC